ncbi:CdiA C-terminal domain-containing protein [Chitinophaga vietnamensis]|uniref:CdiA C-terminal domain-containing protein n=1 Tax=Chitinophaga vietnamensis TaxID=2593957 RepID=UPI0011A8C6E0|nr:RHS repeat-associated core domain-containing protein [Chitinophaga vietnamensis]
MDRSQAWLDGVKAARAANQVKTPAHTMSTVYRYNTLNQVVTQLSPDGGKSRFWYDRLGRLAISQNAKQAVVSAYSYTLYDVLGRITEVGEISSSTPMSDAVSRDATALQTWIDNAGNSKAQITRTVYDIANWALAGGMLSGNNVRNRVAYSMVYNNYADIAGGNYASATFYGYDIHGNVDTLLQDYKKGLLNDGANRFKKIIYDYDLISGKVNLVSYSPGFKDAFYHRYTYDAENRLTNVETSRDSIYWENDAYYQYYKHGPLSRAVIGHQQVQGLDYAYTLQGWLKGVNSTTATSAYDMGGDGQSGARAATDAFGYALHYNGSDYQSINTSVKPFASASVSAGFKPLYNGNIAAMSMQLPKVGEPLLYTYGYDALNRIIAMDANRTFNAATNTWTPTAINDFKERASYDANGNILSYIRNGNNTFAGKPLGMDSLSYNYASGKNRLNYINDAVSGSNYGNDIDNQSPGNYRYDSIGNMTSDVANGIDSIYWTVYGKISRIKKSNGTTIDYTYDVAGNRISKAVSGVQTWYVRDASGNVMSVYTVQDPAINNGRITQTETHLYGSSRLGMSTLQIIPDTTRVPSVTRNGIKNGINVIFTRGNKLFELSNHLGNVLATVSDRRTAVSLNGSSIDHYDPVIASAQEYYPFGSLMPGRGGHLSAAGWSSGSTTVNGYTLPESLTVSQRGGNQPPEYVASTSIDFVTGFDSNTGDNYDAYIADGSYAGGSSGAGSVANSGGGYRYGFNGKENDNEIKGEGNEQDYGFRIYDPRIAKFLSVDPLTQEYPWYTPYQFAGNKPIEAIDLDGAEEWMMQQGFAAKQKAEMEIARADKVAQDHVRALTRIPENHIMSLDVHGVLHIGPESKVKERVAYINEEYKIALGETIAGGPFASAGYLIEGDKGAFKGAVLDQTAMAIGGIPAENSVVFPKQINIGKPLSIPETAQRYPGTLAIEPGGKFSESEIEAAKYMRAQGNDVMLRKPTGTRAQGGTSDLLVNGINYDVYTPITKNPKNIISAIASKNSQATGIVLDLSKTPVTADQLGNVLKRVQGTGAKNIKNIVILPKDAKD